MRSSYRLLMVCLAALIALVPVTTAQGAAPTAQGAGPSTPARHLAPRTMSLTISTPQQLLDVVDDTVYDDTDVIYTLASDLDMTGYPMTQGIGSVARPFRATFDGNNYKISNLVVDDSGVGTVYAGLFDNLGRGGVVKNLTVEDHAITATSTGGSAVAALVAYSEGLVRNVRSYGLVTATSAGVNVGLAGGLIGQGVDDTLTRSASRGTVTATGADAIAGGALGWGTRSHVTEVAAMAEVEAVSTSVTFGALPGGVFGRLDDSTALIQDSYSLGGVHATKSGTATRVDGGGIGGFAVGPGAGSLINRTYAWGEVTQTGFTNAHLGGLVGTLYDDTVSRSFYQDSNASGVGTVVSAAVDDTALSTEEMMSFSSYAGTWPIVDGWVSLGPNVWGICDGQGFPFLLWMVSASPCITGPTVTGSPVVGATLEATATSGGDLTYQWGHVSDGNFSPIQGADDTTYVVTDRDFDDTLAMRVISSTGWTFSVAISPGLYIPIPPPIPSDPPTHVTAQAGDRSATVTWKAPASTGSYPVTNYEAVASPGGASCLTSTLTCEITGLAGGTSYTITVRALTGAGWSAASAPSLPVTPTSRTLVITGARDGKRIEISGSSSGLVGATVQPWLRPFGATEFTATPGTTTVAADGTFSWGRKLNKKATVYVVADGLTSNRVTIPFPSP